MLNFFITKLNDPVFHAIVQEINHIITCPSFKTTYYTQLFITFIWE